MLSEHESADRGVSGTPWGSFTPQPMSRLIQHLATLAEATRRSPAPGVVGVGEWPGSPSPTGALLLLLPPVTAGALNLLPNYDARSAQFLASYPQIVEAGNNYLVSLGLLFVVAAILLLVAKGLRRAPQTRENGAGLLAIGGLVSSSVGFALAALAGLPVWRWAHQVAEGRLTVAEGASRSETLAPLSQTLILLVGLGGMLVALTALGVVAYRCGWTPPAVFWIIISIAAGAVVVGFALTFFWLALGIPPILWTMMIGGSLLVRDGYD